MKLKSLILPCILAVASIASASDPMTNQEREVFKALFRVGYFGPPKYAANPVTCSTTTKGIEYYNTATNIQKTCNGTSWVNTSGDIARSTLVEEALQAYPVDLKTVTFTALAGAEAAGTFNEKVATSVLKLQGEVTDNETEVSVGYFRLMLPAEYVAAGDVVVRFRSALVASGSPVNNGSTLDLECYEQADAAVGADLVTTAAVTYAALDTYYSKDFTVTSTGLVAGDILNCRVTTSIVDSEAGAGTIIWTSDPIKVLLDVKG